MPKIAAKIEPTMIAVVFLPIVELSEAGVGDAGPRELIQVTPVDSTGLGPRRSTDVEPASAVGWKLAPDDDGDAMTELGVVLGVESEE